MRIVLITALWLGLFSCTPSPTTTDTAAPSTGLALDTEEIVKRADELMARAIVPLTDFKADRSAGGPNDYYSEGLYWWPNPDDPDGPYIRRDGQPNPDNFRGHKDAMQDFSNLVTGLTAAYEITGDEQYARRAIEHVIAWFANPETRMTPSLLYGQAIKGINTGRGIGIIDTLRLINVALSIELLERAGVFSGEGLAATKDWFGAYGDWLTTHPYGEDEKTNNNNHSTWWGAQLTAFAQVADRPDLLRIAEEQYRTQLPIQVATDGSLPDELGRTKPFHYLNYTLRAWATYAALLSRDGQDFWREEFTTTLPAYVHDKGEAAGAGHSGEEQRATPKTVTLQQAIDYSLPHMEGSVDWPFATKLEPASHPHRNDFLVFAYWGYGDDKYLDIWNELEPEDDADNANLVIWRKLLQDEN